MAKKRGKIGEVFVEIKGDKGQLTTELLGAEAQIKQTAAQMEVSSTASVTALGRMATAATAVQSAVSKILIPITIISSILGAIALLKRFAEQGKKTAETLDKSILKTAALVRANLPQGFVGDIDADVAKLGALQDKIQKLEGTLSRVSRRDLTGGLARIATQTTEAAIKRQLAPLEAEAGAIQGRLNAIIERGKSERAAKESKEREDSTRERIAQIETENRLLAESLLDPVARAQAELLRVQEEVNRKIKDAEDERVKEALRAQLVAVTQIASAKSAAAQQGANEERRLDEETARLKIKAETRAAQVIADAMAKAITSALNRGLATSEARMNRLVIAAETMVTSVERLRRRINP